MIAHRVDRAGDQAGAVRGGAVQTDKVQVCDAVKGCVDETISVIL